MKSSMLMSVMSIANCSEDRNAFTQSITELAFAYAGVLSDNCSKDVQLSDGVRRKMPDAWVGAVKIERRFNILGHEHARIVRIWYR